MTAKRGIFVAPFDELADPRLLMELPRARKSWAGMGSSSGITSATAPRRATCSICWVALSAIATATERIRIGPMVTPIARRRPHKLARETVTLDHLSQGRLTLGVGLGSDNNGELGPFGEETDPKARASLLDEGLDKLAGYWAGEFEPVPVQQPRIPVWVAGRWPNRRPLRRAARWDGMFPIDLPGARRARRAGCGPARTSRRSGRPV